MKAMFLKRVINDITEETELRIAIGDKEYAVTNIGMKGDKTWLCLGAEEEDLIRDTPQ